MKRSTKIMGCLCVAVAICGAGLVYKHRQGRSKLAQAVALLPADSDGALGINIAGAHGTVVGDRIKAYFDEAFTKKCDAFERIDSVVAAWSMPHDSIDKVAAVVHGRFDREKMLACMTLQVGAAGKQIEQQAKGRHTILAVENIRATLIDDHTLVFGNEPGIAGVLAVVDHEPGARSLGQNGEMLTLLEKTDIGGTLWWAGQVPSGATDLVKSFAGDQSPFASLRDTHGSIALESGLDFHLYLGASEAASARKIVEQAVAGLHLLNGDPSLRASGLAQFIRHLKMNTDGPDFVLNLRLDREQTGRFMAVLGRLKKSPLTARPADRADSLAFSSAQPQR
jgi:hypothetical protein